MMGGWIIIMPELDCGEAASASSLPYLPRTVLVHTFASTSIPSPPHLSAPAPKISTSLSVQYQIIIHSTSSNPIAPSNSLSEEAALHRARE